MEHEGDVSQAEITHPHSPKNNNPCVGRLLCMDFNDIVFFCITQVSFLVFIFNPATYTGHVED